MKLAIVFWNEDPIYTRLLDLPNSIFVFEWKGMCPGCFVKNLKMETQGSPVTNLAAEFYNECWRPGLDCFEWMFTPQLGNIGLIFNFSVCYSYVNTYRFRCLDVHTNAYKCNANVLSCNVCTYA